MKTHRKNMLKINLDLLQIMAVNAESARDNVKFIADEMAELLRGGDQVNYEKTRVQLETAKQHRDWQLKKIAELKAEIMEQCHV